MVSVSDLSPGWSTQIVLLGKTLDLLDTFPHLGVLMVPVNWWVNNLKTSWGVLGTSIPSRKGVVTLQVTSRHRNLRDVISNNEPLYDGALNVAQN